VDVALADRVDELLAQPRSLGDVQVRGEGHVHLIADLGGVEFIDSTGFGVLVGGLKRVRGSKGQIRLANPNQSVTRLLRITGLGKVFATFPTVQEAVSAPLVDDES
jgi:anti-sigma B factor antagonist